MSLYFSGPSLKKALAGHEMVNLNGKLVVIGGHDGNSSQDSLHELACYNSYCFWQEMEQKLKNRRSDVVAMGVPDAFVDCCDTSVDPKCTEICKEDEIKCKTTFRCIKKSSLCDGTKDCSDYSDEDNCIGFTVDNLIKCQNTSQFIRNHWKCDGFEDCVDGSDEQNCTECKEDAFKCANGSKCILKENTCDGVIDCHDDEENCKTCDG